MRTTRKGWNSIIAMSVTRKWEFEALHPVIPLDRYALNFHLFYCHLRMEILNKSRSKIGFYEKQSMSEYNNGMPCIAESDKEKEINGNGT